MTPDATLYLNNAGTSWPKPDSVHSAVGHALRASPHELGDLLSNAQTLLADFLGLDHPDRLLFTPGCTSALQIAISELPWQPGDCVVTSALEHHALVRPVQQLARRGVQHAIAPYRHDAPMDLGFVEERLAVGNVRLIAVSAAANVTGEALPVQQLAALAHCHGALLLVDCAQSAGVLPPEQATANADLVTFAGHKALLGPQGIGGLWAAPHVSFDCPTAVCEIGGATDAAPGTARGSFPGYCDVGSVNVAAVAGLVAGVGWLQQNPTAMATPNRLAQRLHDELLATDGLDACNAGPPSTGAVSLAVHPSDPNRVARFLASHHVIVRAGQHCAPLAIEAIGASAAGTLRVGFGVFNTDADLQRLLTLLRSLVVG